ncbi:hypothetical protein GA0115243_105938 [Streptomyces sp. ScaeMP-e83]|nr:hypothetical protein GA0115243_105938 [Streptomyces sp. ScaeMP-e83]
MELFNPHPHSPRQPEPATFSGLSTLRHTQLRSSAYVARNRPIKVLAAGNVPGGSGAMDGAGTQRQRQSARTVGVRDDLRGDGHGRLFGRTGPQAEADREAQCGQLLSLDTGFPQETQAFLMGAAEPIAPT